MEMLLKKVLEQLKEIEVGILHDFLENPLLANYDVSNLKPNEHTHAHAHHEHDKGDESARNENIAARVSSIKKKNCETKGKRLS